MRTHLIEIKHNDPKSREMSQNWPNGTKVFQNYNNPVDLNSAKSLKSGKIARTQLIEIK